MPPVATKYFAFNGGLDQVTPPIELTAGTLRYCNNVEIGIRGGYSRIGGYERYSGLAKPSAASYALLAATITGTIPIGATITNDAGTVSAVVIAVEAAAIIVTRLTGGAFMPGALRIGGLVVATQTALQGINLSSTPKLNATYLNLAADVYRAMIGAVPGSGPVLGVHQYGGKVYAFRNNAGGTAAVMHVASPAGWTPVALGRELKFAQRTGTVTITIASPGVFTWAGGVPTPANGQRGTLSTTGVLPGLLAGSTYYVVNVAGSTFQLSTTAGGAAIATTGTQSGVHTFNLRPTEIMDGDTVTGSISGATGVVKRVAVSYGTWDDAPIGSLIFATITGTFISGEALLVGGVATVNTTSTAAQITLLPGGRYQFQNYNFGGQVSTLRMYGVDGKNRGFEFDGTTYTPITTGMDVDAPLYMKIHKKQLFFAFASSLQHSAIGDPYSFAPIYGAAELAVGDTVTGMLVVPGSDGTGAMAVFTTNSTSILYGNSVDDWNLITYSEEAGAFPHTMQYVRDGIVLDSQGLTTLTATQSFGNFASAIVSDLISPFLNERITMATASCTVRRKNQYRLFLSTGEAVYLTYSQGKINGMTTMTMPDPVACISSQEGATGLEEIYFGSTDGYVYQMDIGTSFDGDEIAWSALLSFNHFGGPRQLKRFRKTAIEVSGQGYAEMNFSTSLAYGSTEYAQSFMATLQAGAGGASFWDSFVFDQFYWDGQSLLPAEADTVGTAENISLLFSGSSDEFQPFTLTSAVMHYTPQRSLR